MGLGSEEYFKRTKAAKLGRERFEDIAPRGEKRRKHFEAWEEDLGKVAKLYQLNGRGENMGYVMGDAISYADFIVAGWVGLAMLVLDEGEWEGVKSWHGEFWGRALEGTDEWRVMSHST